jgi:hypothetical protein
VIRPFVQVAGGTSTADAMTEIVDAVDPDAALFVFAYATMSGCAEFRRRFGDRFFAQGSRWLVGIDHGRTEPAALSFLARRLPVGRLRVHDGVAVATSPGFRPSRDFHLKGCHFANGITGRSGLVAGSGNLSRSGLVLNVEMGFGVTARRRSARHRAVASVLEALDGLFDGADQVEAVLPEYRRRWRPSYASGNPARPNPDPGVHWDRFWIEVGYVTPNRGAHLPGNQFDMPRGVHRFFGLEEPPGADQNTPIGDVVFVGVGPRLLRLGNNWMEKLTLPYPEDLGFGAYDGTVLEFRRGRRGFRLLAHDPERFDVELARTPVRASHRMGSGRRYGFRNDP